MATVEIVTDPQRWSAIKDQWNATVDAAGAGVYLTWEWLFPWWAHTADTAAIERRLRICLVWEQDRLLGIAPFFLERRFRWKLEVERCLRLLGNGGESNRHDLVALPGHEAQVGELVATEVLRHRLADSTFLWDVPRASPTVGHFLAAMKGRGADVREDWGEQRYVTLLAPTFDELLAGLHKQRRREFRRATEECEQQGVTVELASRSGPSLDAGMQALFDLHVKRWTAAGDCSNTFCERGSRERMLALVRSLHGRGQVHLGLLRRGEDVIAARLSFLDRRTGTAYGQLCAHDLAWESFAPGTFVLMTTFRDVIDAGLSRYDHGWGEQEYKTRYKPVVAEPHFWVRVKPSARHVRPLATVLNGLRSTRRRLATTQHPSDARVAVGSDAGGTDGESVT
jgi:CelD/BcsL family acetyltransferase involved in cellulose biosynthesis